SDFKGEDGVVYTLVGASPPLSEQKTSGAPSLQVASTLQTDMRSVESGAAPQRAIHEYVVEADIPWDKLSDFTRGVIIPLQSKGAKLTITIRLHAYSDKGIEASVIEHPVRETLRQIGATVLSENCA
ncbi:MAG: hypothetical protein RML15_04845, partial [Bacteroidota bacterium]|nr:hypothetical protein [Bacteroidota bacterium]